MSTTRSLSIAATLSLVSPCFLACTPANDNGTETPASGTLEMPLVTEVDGHEYRLSGGYLYVSGPTFQYVDLLGDVERVSLSLPTGEYYAVLQFPLLERDDGSGNFVAVDATLVSNNPLPFRIYDGTTSSIAFEFETNGAIVRIGAGSLDIRIDVTETPAICTPFTNDCGEGFWCPPSELTGAPRQCVSAGPLLPGEPCASPIDCSAESSCFDFGGGPVCASLCAASEFDAACAGGGECVAAGIEYGVCTPVAANQQ